MAPTWGELAESYSGDSDVVIGHVDCTKEQVVCNDLAIRGYPVGSTCSGHFIRWSTDIRLEADDHCAMPPAALCLCHSAVRRMAAL